MEVVETVERVGGGGNAVLVLVRHEATGLTEWRFAADHPEKAPAPAGARRGGSLKAKARKANGAEADEGALEQAKIDAMHRMWLQVGKPATWIYWATDNIEIAIGRALDARNFVIIDDFLQPEMTAAIAREVAAARAAGLLAPGALAGGRNGTNLTYVHTGVRGDEVGWFDGDERCWNQLPLYFSRLRALVSLLRENRRSRHVSGVGHFSRAMVACYPGNGAAYRRHCDNACDAGKGERCNGRRLTAVFYLNRDWKPQHGGQLRIFPPNDAHGSEPVAEVAPLAGRLLLFLSDHRCPHEVLPSHVMRYAVTVWFFDDDEYERAQRCGHAVVEGGEAQAGAAAAQTVDELERQRIRSEIAKFEKQLGGRASIVRGDGGVADACGDGGG